MRGSTSPTDLRPGGKTGRRAFDGVLFTGFLFFVCVQPSSVEAEGSGPFPVRNFQPVQQLVLSMPGDWATVLKLDVRLEFANTASIYRDEGFSSPCHDEV